MPKINLSRVVWGGIVAGIVANLLAFVVDGAVLGQLWRDAMKALGRDDFTPAQIVQFNILGILNGVLIVWLYAAIRPRYGAGPATAVRAAVAVWIAGSLLANLAFMGVTGLYPAKLMTITTAGALLEYIAGALAGAALYKE